MQAHNRQLIIPGVFAVLFTLMLAWLPEPTFEAPANARINDKRLGYLYHGLVLSLVGVWISHVIFTKDHWNIGTDS